MVGGRMSACEECQAKIAKVVKNKVSAPFRSAEFDILFGEGISMEGDLIELGVEHKIIEKSGAWYSHGEMRIGQGRENVRLFLKENTDVRDGIEKALREKLGLTTPTGNGAAAGEKPAAAGEKPAVVAEQPPGPQSNTPSRGRGRARAGA